MYNSFTISGTIGFPCATHVRRCCDSNKIKHVNILAAGMHNPNELRPNVFFELTLWKPISEGAFAAQSPARILTKFGVFKLIFLKPISESPFAQESPVGILTKLVVFELVLRKIISVRPFAAQSPVRMLTRMTWCF